jgi:FkbM family methyltransferase
MKYTTYSEVKSSLIFKYKAYLKKILVLIFSRSKFKIFINSTNELIISRYLEKTISKIRIADTVESIEKINNLKFRKFVFDNFKFISEGIQVLWVMYLLDCKRNGYFVEFGACDGLHFSNTNLLEKEFGWTGILAEPSRSYSKSISKNRNATIDRRVVWSRTGETIEFAEVSAGGLSGVYSSFRDGKNSLDKRTVLGIKKYLVETISLNDLLSEYEAPLDFDFLSIDTEGSEMEIIKNFDLNKFRPKIITIEIAGDLDLESEFKKIFLKYGYKSVGSELNDKSNVWFILDKIHI